jgi:nucleoside-diphosphate-sugar epimerase
VDALKTIPVTTAAVLGATGPTGIHLVATLRRKGAGIRVISRNRSHLERRFPDSAVEKRQVDAAAGGAELAAALAGCDVVFDCIGMAPDAMPLHPVAARHLAAALRETKCRCVKVTSFWSYLPTASLPLNEMHPRTGGPPWVRWRREAEDILHEAGAAVVHLPDFYGPEVRFSVLQQPLAEALGGRTMNWIGAVDTPHEYAFVPDAMEIAAHLATCEAAYGAHWIVPGAGPVTGRQIADIVTRTLQRRVKMRGAGMVLLRVAGMFNRELRGFLQVAPDYLRPITYDASRLRRLIGERPITPYDEGIRRTISWLQEQGRGRT